jgi:hypothetical protein
MIFNIGTSMLLAVSLKVEVAAERVRFPECLEIVLIRGRLMVVSGASDIYGARRS